MTNVYGVTFAGAKKQVCKQIDALVSRISARSAASPTCSCQHTLPGTSSTALATMFRGAHDIQYWLGEIGGRVCRALTPAQLQQIADSYADGNMDDGATRQDEARKSSAAKAGKIWVSTN